MSRRKRKSVNFVCCNGVAFINAERLARLHWDNSPETFCTLSCVPDLRLTVLCIVSTMSAPPREWPERSVFLQPSIQTWAITARLQKHFPCTQGLASVSGGYFQSLRCHSECQVNTGWQTEPLERPTSVALALLPYTLRCLIHNLTHKDTHTQMERQNAAVVQCHMYLISYL